jgi:hypothetical protein
MRKITFLIFAFLWVAVFFAHADIKIGVKAGVNVAKASFDKEVLDRENLVGFQVGPILEFSSKLGIGFDAAILYNQLKLKNDYLRLEETMNMVDVPVNLKWKLVLFNFFGGYLTAGPYVSFKLKDNRFSWDNIENIKTECENKSFGAGLNLGFGIELVRHLQVGANYKLGLTDDYKSFSSNINENTPIRDFKAKTRDWSLTLTYFF